MSRQSSLITQYIEGTLVGRELQDMLRTFAAEDRFDRELREMENEERLTLREHIARDCKKET